MIDLENLFLREETRISPIKSNTNEFRSEPNGQRTEFDRIFQDHIQAEEAAKSGKKAPIVPSAEAVSEYRSLAGGAQLILGGADPTEESIANYAVAQGIDPEILSLLMPRPLKNTETHSGQYLKLETSVTASNLSGLTSSLAIGAQLILDGADPSGEVINTGKTIKAETGVTASNLPGPTSTSAIGAQLILDGADPADEVINTEKPIKAEVGVTASNLSGLTSSLAIGAQLILDGADPADEVINTEKPIKAEVGVTASNLSGLTSSIAIGAQLTLSGAGRTNESIANFAAGQSVDPEILSLLMPSSLKNTETHSGQHLKAGSSLYSGILSEHTGNDKSIKAEVGVTVSTLSILAQNKIVQISNEVSLEKIQALKQQFTISSGSSKLKLDAIYLGRGAEDLISGIEQKTNFHMGLGAPRTESLLNIGQLSVVESRADLINKSLVETISIKDESAAIRRQEQFLETSRRLTQAIGERLTTQITKGAWSVEMELHPKSLGRIEIQLEMRNGELAAQFNPSQNVTRDLLQESFDKLKAILAEHGIDSAYIGLGNGEKQSFDGKPTGDELDLEERKDDNIEEMQVPEIVVSDRIGSDGLDVQV